VPAGSAVRLNFFTGPPTTGVRVHVPGIGRGTAARIAADRRGPEQYGVWRMSSLILAVDDSASMRQMVNFTLKGAGYQVVQATDGVEALEYARGNAVDLVLTDVNMPRMDGITLVRELRALATYRYTPMLVLTTESSQEKKMQGKQAGATGWIVKPFNPDQLLATIARVL
jgi:two-component system chemotaxis response regulator CheY